MTDYFRKIYFGALLVVAAFLSFLFSSNTMGNVLLTLGVVFILVEIWRNPEYGIYYTIFFLPLTKTKILPLVGSKLILADLFFVFTVFVFFIKKKEVFSEMFNSVYAKILGVFLLFNLLSVFKAISYTTWFVEVLTYFYLAFFFLFMAKVIDSRNFEKVLKVLLLSLSLVVLIGLIGYLLYLFEIENPLMFYYRVSSTFKAVNQLSMSLLVIFFLMLFKSESFIRGESINKGVFLSFIAIFASFVFLASGTRIVPFILLPTLLIYNLHYLARKKFPATGLLVFTIVLLLFLFPSAISEHKGLDRAFETITYLSDEKDSGEYPDLSEEEKSKVMEIVRPREEKSKVMEIVRRTDITRYHQLKAFFSMIPENYLLGVGSGNFVHHMPDHTDSEQYWEMHNTFLGILAESGVFGFVSFVVFLFLLLFRALKEFVSSKNDYLFVFLLGILSNLTFGMVHFGLRNRYMWLGLAILVLLVENGRKN